MISNFIIALLMFFNFSVGQVDSNAGKTPPKSKTPEKTIIVDITP
ncbi:MAG: hypothetical protein AAFZ63_26790 [Bacteroidota bacterium]